MIIDKVSEKNIPLSALDLFAVTYVFGDFSVSGGLVSLVEGSYEYHHYLQDGFDDSVMSLLTFIVVLFVVYSHWK